MGRRSGPPKRGKIADLTIQPQQEPGYEPPPTDECEEQVWPLLLPEPGHKLIIRQVWHRDRMVDFAVVQVVRTDTGWQSVAKIDCSRGTIHRHQFDRAGEDLWDHRLIKVIPVDGWDVVDEGYGLALAIMEDEWQENYRRWDR
jgi:hypothetical protein